MLRQGTDASRPGRSTPTRPRTTASLRAALPGPPAAAVVPDPAPPLPDAASPRHRRNPKWIALGVIAICLGALASFVLYGQVAESHRVVVVREAVPRGTAIEARDLTVVTVGNTDGIETVDGDQLTSVVGRRSAVDLVPGTLLPPAAAATEPLPAPKRAIVGIRLTDGRAPRGQLDPSSPLRLVAVPPANAEAGYRDAYSDLSVSGRVVEVTGLSDGQSVLVDVDVAADQAADVARLAAQDRIVAIRDAEG